MEDVGQKLLRIFKDLKAGLSGGSGVEEKQSEMGDGGRDPIPQSSTAVPLTLEVEDIQWETTDRHSSATTPASNRRHSNVRLPNTWSLRFCWLVGFCLLFFLSTPSLLGASPSL